MLDLIRKNRDGAADFGGGSIPGGAVHSAGGGEIEHAGRLPADFVDYHH